MYLILYLSRRTVNLTIFGMGLKQQIFVMNTFESLRFALVSVFSLLDLIMIRILLVY